MSDEVTTAVAATNAAETLRPAGLALFRALGEEQSAEGHEPFVIDGADNVWLVIAGTVHLFAVQVAGHEPVGAREHFVSVAQGDLFFGMDFARYGAGHGFLASGTTGARVIRASLAQVLSTVRQPAADQVYRGDVAALIERWIIAVSEAVTRNIPNRVKPTQLVNASEPFHLAKGGIASTKKEAVWLAAGSSELFFLSAEELFFAREHSVFPLAPGTWVETFEPRDFKTLDTLQVLAEGRLDEGLENFHIAICSSEFINKRLAQVDEFNRLKTKAEYQQAARESALAEIAAVLNPEYKDLSDARADGGGDALLSAMRLVGRSLGAEVKPHPNPSKQDSMIQRLNSIINASRLRVRDIALRDQWWHLDNGPFLAFWEEDMEPCALLPDGARRYFLVKGRTGEKMRVTAEVAEKLHPIAKSLYRPFPEGRLTARKLAAYGARGLRGEFLTVIAMGIGLGLLGMLTPYFTSQIFDTVIPGAAFGQLWQMVGGMVAAAIGMGVFEFVRGVATTRVESRMDYSIQSALWDRLMSLPLSFFRQYTAGDLANRAYGIDKIRELVSGGGTSAVLGMVSALFFLFQMFQFDFKLALAGTGLSLGAAAFMALMNLWQLSYNRHLFGVIGRITSVIFQFIMGVAKIRVAGAEDHAFKVWTRHFTTQRRISWSVGRISNILATFNTTFPVISSLFLFYFMQSSQEAAAEAGQAGETISTGDFIAFNAAFGAFLGAILQLSSASLQIFQCIPVYERFKPILTEEPEIDEAKSYPGDLTGEMEVYHVNFRYQPDGPLILKNVSIHIKPGQFVAFVGPSGSGKSTLLRLLMGFDKPESGKVYYDGQDLASLDIREVRRQIGVVLQTSRLMPTDVYRNIIGNNSSITIEQAMEAASMAGLDEDIKKMPMGMHTVVSEGGGGFSGGQKQRLMIARALVNKPRMLFLDEATSALDNRSQAIVTQSMDRLQATRVVVAHRLSTIMNADCIFVLVDGRVTEQGSYHELMALDGHFAELARRQIA
ncbi:MAG: NHLP bacteriocin export ABC transporter permease/ATPase subunit [Verrucomicrobiales bacterium]